MINEYILPNTHRQGIVHLLHDTQNNIGVELGVGEGIFSERMIRSNNFRTYIGIDSYYDKIRGHNVEQYKRVIQRLKLISSDLISPLCDYKLFRMDFFEALDLFNDYSLDFCYIDGYAHDKDQHKELLDLWYPKVSVGGVFAGDDYDKELWPGVYDNVNNFCLKHGYTTVYRTEIVEADPFCKSPSWGIVVNYTNKVFI